MIRHFVLPDTQVSKGVPLDHLVWAGKAIAEYEPDVLVCLGDFADMPSLSSYASRKEAEGRRYRDDIDAADEAMSVLFDAIAGECTNRAKKAWCRRVRKVLVLGNHEYRIQRAIDENPHLDGLMSMSDLGYEKWGWEVYPFLEIVEIDGVAYSHYLQNGMGRPLSGQIETQIKTAGFSHVVGHLQGLRVGLVPRNNGAVHRGVSCGSFYLQDEPYLKQSNAAYWRGCVVLNDVRRGNFDLLELSLDYLCRRFGPGCHVHQFMRRKYPKLYRTSSWVKQEQRTRS